MGRLENFIPIIDPFTSQDGDDLNVVKFNGTKALIVGPEAIAFLKQINGHLSLREIFLFLNEKKLFFRIEKCLEVLRQIANAGLMRNSEDFFAVIHGAPAGRVHKPNTQELSPSYFSHERLVGLIQKTTLFLKCDRSVAEKILKHSRFKHVPENSRIIKEGSKSKDFYVLLAGEVGVYRQDECLATMGPLSVFGESAAIFDKVRNADVITLESSWVLCVDASKIIDTQDSEAFDSFKGLKSRLILNQTLSANPLFKKLPNDVMQFFISKCRIEKYGREQIVIEQGETSGDFYFILKGSVSVIKDGMPVTSLAEGNHFGEVAAMLNEPRTASVICETGCTFIVLNQKSLLEVLSSHFRLAIDIEKTALERKNSQSNLLEIFEDDESPVGMEPLPADDDSSSVVSLDDLSNSNIAIDGDFFEASQTNFELELVDFSTFDSKEDAS